MISDLVAQYYAGVTGFTTSASMHAKLGDALTRRNLSPYIFETEEEARAKVPGV